VVRKNRTLRLEPALRGTLLPVKQLELEELERVGQVVDVVGRRLLCHFLALGRHRRQAQVVLGHGRAQPARKLRQLDGVRRRPERFRPVLEAEQVVH
jgi:hypothetical protein